MQPRILYVELKTGFNDDGPAWITWASFSKTGRTVYAKGRTLRLFSGGWGANHYDVESGEEWWVSGPKGNQQDRHWAGKGPVIIDEDAREAYAALLAAKRHR